MLRLAALLVCGCAGLLAPTAALAHATLLEARPADGMRLEQAPAQIALRFDEPVQPVSLKVLDSQGRDRLGSTPVRAEGEWVRAALPPDQDKGTYVVSYRVISADAHPVFGSIVYAVGAPVDTRLLARRGADFRAWRVAEMLNRAAHLGSMALFFGGVLFLLLVSSRDPDSLRTLFVATGTLAAVSAMVAVGLQGVSMEDASLSLLLEGSPWQRGAETTRGMASEVALAGLALAALGLWGEIRAVQWVGALAGLASFVVSGHAVATPPRDLSFPAWAIHTAIMVFWVGSLVPLLQALRGGRGEQPLRRFSALAVVAVPAAVAAGVLMAALQLGDIAQLAESYYGNVLQLKVLLVGAMLSMAACNRWWFLPQLKAGSGVAQSLRASILAEVFLGLAVLGVSAVLSNQVPPRGAARVSGPATASAVLGVLQAAIEVSPAVKGANTVRVTLRDGERQPADRAEVALVFSLPSAGIEPTRRVLRRTAAGEYTYEGNDMALPGRWKLRLEALVSDFERNSVSVDIDIRE